MRYLGILIAAVLLSSCGHKGQNQTSGLMPEKDRHMVEVEQVIHTTKYTYLKVKELENLYWIAVTKTDARIGEFYYFRNGLQMNEFQSKELGRTFDVVYFVNEISKDPMDLISNSKQGSVLPKTTSPIGSINQRAHSGKVQVEKNEGVSLTKTEGEVTIADLYANKDIYANKTIRISGIVVKINKSIMGRNWIHIQDGTESGQNYDLAVTSQDISNVGDKVTFEGIISVNKDFGSGYFYDLILENAVLLN